jgi:hypothetical protein
MATVVEVVSVYSAIRRTHDAGVVRDHGAVRIPAVLAAVEDPVLLVGGVALGRDCERSTRTSPARGLGATRGAW